MRQFVRIAAARIRILSLSIYSAISGWRSRRCPAQTPAKRFGLHGEPLNKMIVGDVENSSFSIQRPMVPFPEAAGNIVIL